MNLGIVKVIFFKEMLDTLRDKRTLLAMIGVPVVLYPAMIIIMTQVMLVQRTKVEATVSKVVVRAEDDAQLREWISEIDMVEQVESETPDDDLAEGTIDALVVAEDGWLELLENDDSAAIEIQFDSTRPSSREAVDRLRDAFEERGESFLTIRLAEKGLPENFAKPLAVESKNVAPASKVVGFVLGMILPMIMILMLGVGAFYPAVDLTAGEKERGTFETLLSTPTTKLEIVAGKFLTVFLLSVSTGLLNLFSMALTIMFQISQLNELRPELQEVMNVNLLSLSVTSVVIMIAMLIPLAFFISAMMMSVALLARSFKEAQNYVTPFFIAIIIPGTIGALPDVELSPATQFIPIANIALLFRDLLMDQGSAESVFIVFVSTCVYAMLGLLTAVWIFQREEIILSEEKGIPITFRRDTIRPRSVPTPMLALAALTFVVLLVFYVGSYAQAKSIHVGLLITEYALILGPVLFMIWYARVNLRNALNLRAPALPALIGTALIAIGALPIVAHLGVLQGKVLPLPEEFEQFGELLFDMGANPWGLPALLFIIALSPAICEEALFRGLLLSGLRPRMPTWAVVLTVGIIFGLFHMSIYRFVPTALLGVALTYVVVRSGSIYAGVLGHVIVNGLSVLVQTGNVPKGLLDFLEDPKVEETGMPWTVLVGATVLIVLGVAAVEMSARARGPSGRD